MSRVRLQMIIKSRDASGGGGGVDHVIGADGGMMPMEPVFAIGRGGREKGIRGLGKACIRIVMLVLYLPLLLPIFNFIPWDVMVSNNLHNLQFHV